MRLSVAAAITFSIRVEAGTNKTLAPTPGFIRSTPFPTATTPVPTPAPQTTVTTPAPTPCEDSEFWFNGNECTNEVASGDGSYATVQECCNAHFGPGSHIDGTCGYVDICGVPVMSMDYGILDHFSSGKSGKSSGHSMGDDYASSGSADGSGKSGKAFGKSSKSSGKSSKSSEGSSASGAGSEDGHDDHGYIYGDAHSNGSTVGSSSKGGKSSGSSLHSAGKSGKSTSGSTGGSVDGWGHDGHSDDDWSGSGGSSKGSKGYSSAGKSGKSSSESSGESSYVSGKSSKATSSSGGSSNHSSNAYDYAPVKGYRLATTSLRSSVMAIQIDEDMLRGTNKTLAPTPGFTRPTPFPTEGSPPPSPGVDTPAPTTCKEQQFWYDGEGCTNEEFPIDSFLGYNSLMACCDDKFGPESLTDANCEYTDICNPTATTGPPVTMSMDYGIIASFGSSGKSGKSTGSLTAGSSRKSGKSSDESFGKSGKSTGSLEGNDGSGDGDGHGSYGPSDDYVSSDSSGTSNSGCAGKPDFYENQVSDDYLLKYLINEPEGTITMEVTYDGEAWVAVGFSTDGQMIGSEAVIGIPGENGDVPQKYYLSGKSPSAVVPMPEDQQTLTDASVDVSNGQTVMKFTKKMDEPGEIEIVIGDNNFLWAYGSSTTLDYHAQREAYVQNLSIGESVDCGSSETGSAGSDGINDNEGYGYAPSMGYSKGSSGGSSGKSGKSSESSGTSKGSTSKSGKSSGSKGGSNKGSQDVWGDDGYSHGSGKSGKISSAKSGSSSKSSKGASAGSSKSSTSGHSNGYAHEGLSYGRRSLRKMH